MLPTTNFDQSISPITAIKPKKPRKVGKKIDTIVDDSFILPNSSLASDSNRGPQPRHAPSEPANSPATMNSAPRSQKLPLNKPNSLAHPNPNPNPNQPLPSTSSNLQANPSSTQPIASDSNHDTPIRPVPKKRKRNTIPSVIATPTQPGAGPSKYYSEPAPQALAAKEPALQALAAKNASNLSNQIPTAPSGPAPVASPGALRSAKRPKPTPRSKSVPSSSTPKSQPAPQESVIAPAGVSVPSAPASSLHPKKKKLKTLHADSQFTPQSSTKSTQAALSGRQSMPPGSFASDVTSAASTPGLESPRKRCKSITGLPLSTKPVPLMFNSSLNPSTFSVSKPAEQSSKTSASSSLPNAPTAAIEWSQMSPEQILARYGGLGATKATPQKPKKTTKTTLQNVQLAPGEKAAQPAETVGTQSTPAGATVQPMGKAAALSHSTSNAVSSQALLSSATAEPIPDHQKQSKQLKSAMKKAQPQAPESLPSAPESTAQTTNQVSPHAIPTSKSALSSSTPQLPEALPKSKANKNSKKAIPVLSDMSHVIENAEYALQQTLPLIQPEQSAPSLSAQQTFETKKMVKGVKTPKKSARIVDEASSTFQGTENVNEPALPPSQTEPSATFSFNEASSEAPKKVRTAKKSKKGAPAVAEDLLRPVETDHANDASASNPLQQTGPSGLDQPTGEALKQTKEVKTLKNRTQLQYEANLLPLTELVNQETLQRPDTVSSNKKAPSNVHIPGLQPSVPQETASPANQALPERSLSTPADSTILTVKESKSRRKSQMGARVPSQISSETFTTEEYTLPLDSEAQPAGNHEAVTRTIASEAAEQDPTEPLPIDSIENLTSSNIPPIMSQVLMEKAAKKKRLLAVKPRASSDVNNSGPTSSYTMGPQAADRTAPDPLLVKDLNNLTPDPPTLQSQQVPAEKPSQINRISNVKLGASQKPGNLAPSSGHELSNSSHALDERKLQDSSQSGDGQIPMIVSKSKSHSKPSRISKPNVETQTVLTSTVQAESSTRDESEIDLLASSSEPSSSLQQHLSTTHNKGQKRLLAVAERACQESVQGHLNQQADKVVAGTSFVSLESQPQPSREDARSGGDGNDAGPAPVIESKTTTVSSKAKKKTATASNAGPDAGQQGPGISGKEQTLKLPLAVQQPCEAPKSRQERDGEQLVQTSNQASGVAGSQHLAQGKLSKRQKQKNIGVSHGKDEEHGTRASDRQEEAGGSGVVEDPQRGQVQVVQEHASAQLPHPLSKIAPASAPVLDPPITPRPAPQAEQRALGGSYQTDVGEESIPIIKAKKKKDKASVKVNQQNPARTTMSTAGSQTDLESADKMDQSIHVQTSKKRKHQNVAPAQPSSTIMAPEASIGVDEDGVVEPTFKKARTLAQTVGLPIGKPTEADGTVSSISKNRRNRRKKDREAAVPPQAQKEREELLHDGPPALLNASPTRPVLPADGVVPVPSPPQLKDKGAQQSEQVATENGPVKFGRWELSILPEMNVPENVFARLQTLLDEALRAGVAKPITSPSGTGSRTGSQVMANAIDNDPSRAISQPAVSFQKPASQSVNNIGRSAPQPAVDFGPPASELLADSTKAAYRPVTGSSPPQNPIPQSINPASQTKPIEKPRSGGSDESLEARIRRLSGPLLKKPTSILNGIVSSEDESDNQRSEYVGDESSSEPGLSRLMMLKQRYRRQSSSPEELSDESEFEDGPAVISKNGLAARPVDHSPVSSSSSHGLGDDSEPEDGPAVSVKTAGAGRAIEQPSNKKASSKEFSDESSEPEDMPCVSVKVAVPTQSAKQRASTARISSGESRDDNLPENRHDVSIRAQAAAHSAKRLSVTSSSSEESSNDSEHENGFGGPMKKPMAVRTSGKRLSGPIEPSDRSAPIDSLVGTAKVALAARPADQLTTRNSDPEEPSDESERDEGPVVSMKVPVTSQIIKRPSITSSSSDGCSDESHPDVPPGESRRAPVVSQSIKRPSITSSSSADSSDESGPENVPGVTVKNPLAAQPAQQSPSSSSRSEESNEESEPEDGPAGSEKICVAGGLTKQSSIRAPVVEDNQQESCERSLSVNVSALLDIGITQTKTTTASQAVAGSAVRNASDLSGTVLSKITFSQDSSQLRKSENGKKTNNEANRNTALEKGSDSQLIERLSQETSTSDQAKQTSLSELSDISDDVQDVVMMALNLAQTEGYGLEADFRKVGRGHQAKSCDQTKKDGNESRKAAVLSPLVAQSVVFTSDTNVTSATSLPEQSMVECPTKSSTGPVEVCSMSHDNIKRDRSSKRLLQQGMSAIAEKISMPFAILDSASPVGNTTGETTDITATPKERAEESPTITSGHGVDDSDSEVPRILSEGEATTVVYGRATEHLSAVQAEPDSDHSSGDETSSETNEETCDDERPPTSGQKRRKASRKENVAEEPTHDSHKATGPHLASSQPLQGSKRTAADLHARTTAPRRKTLDHFRPVDFSLSSSQPSLNSHNNHSGLQDPNLVGDESNSESSSSDEESSDDSLTKQVQSGGLPKSKLAGANPGGLSINQRDRVHNNKKPRRKSAAEMWAKEEAKIMKSKKKKKEYNNNL